MPKVCDVAAYILSKRGEMTAMKLQKLVYYSQAWSLVWDDAPLFDAPIEAWANGPVVPELYNCHRGLFILKDGDISGNASAFSPTQLETIDSVLSTYGDKTSQWLSDLTHAEKPWLDARNGLLPGQRGNSLISHASMAEYYGSL